MMPDASGFKHPSVAAERQTAFTIDASQWQVGSWVVMPDTFASFSCSYVATEMQLSQSLHSQWHAESRLVIPDTSAYCRLYDTGEIYLWSSAHSHW
jgi:hypothetical protein